MRKQASIILLAIALTLSACIPSVESPNQEKSTTDNSTTSIRVFADTALLDALTEIGKNYEAGHPGSTVKLSFSNSKHLRELVEQGKTADLLILSIPSETADLTEQGYIRAADTKKIATSRLVVAVAAGNPGNIQSAQDLSRPGLKLGIMVETSSLGRQTRTLLENLNANYGSDYMELAMTNVTANEEDADVLLNQLRSGEIEACIIDSIEIANNPDITLVEIPAEANVYRHYDISILAKSKKIEQSTDFMNYLFSPEGQAVLTKWGFTVQLPK